MHPQLRGIAFAFGFLAILLGVGICSFNDFPGSADVTIFGFLLFFFLSGVVMRYRDEIPLRELGLASLIPPLLTVVYIAVAARRLGCDEITGGVTKPTWDYLAELFAYGVALIWLGIGASTIVKAAAVWYDSPRFLNFMARQTRRAAALGEFFDKVSGISKIAKIVKRLSGGGQ